MAETPTLPSFVGKLKDELPTYEDLKADFIGRLKNLYAKILPEYYSLSNKNFAAENAYATSGHNEWKTIEREGTALLNMYLLNATGQIHMGEMAKSKLDAENESPESIAPQEARLLEVVKYALPFPYYSRLRDTLPKLKESDLTTHDAVADKQIEITTELTRGIIKEAQEVARRVRDIGPHGYVI